MAVRDLSVKLRRRLSKPRTSSIMSNSSPWWVRALTTGGRPIVAAAVLTMCAPGEHHLAVLAGWDSRLAWGMAAVLAAYAGIAAAVASARPAGSPGKRSAIAGAFTSLGAAMAAQPVSHLFVTGHLSATPHAPIWLVVIVSCVPPLVLGHLLHLAATPVAHPVAQPQAPEQAPAAQLITKAPAPVMPVSLTKPTPAVRAPLSKPLPAITARITTPVSKPSHHLLTTRDVAALKGVSTSTVGTWVGRKKLIPVLKDEKLGNLFDPASLN